MSANMRARVLSADTTELVQTWRAELFGEHGTLNDKLIGAAR